MTRMCTSWLDLSNRLPSTLNRNRMQTLGPREVGVSTNHLGVHKPCDGSFPRVRFFPLWLHVYDKKALQSPFVMRLGRMSITTTSLLIDKAITILTTLFYSLLYSIHFIEFEFIVSLCSLPYLCVLCYIYAISFRSHINLDHWYQSDLLFCYFSMHVQDEVGI